MAASLTSPTSDSSKVTPLSFASQHKLLSSLQKYHRYSSAPVMSEYRTARKPLGGAHLQEYRRNRGPSPLFVHSSSPSVGAVDNDFSDISSDERIVTVRNER
jgi:hypothetical protein